MHSRVHTTYPRVHTTALFFIRAEFAKKKKKNAVEEPFLSFPSLVFAKSQKKRAIRCSAAAYSRSCYNTLFIMENKN
jgi:hypothetical protein